MQYLKIAGAVVATAAAVYGAFTAGGKVRTYFQNRSADKAEATPQGEPATA